MTQYDYSKLLAEKPFTLSYYRGIRLVEHPSLGDTAPVIAMYKGKAWCTGFYDPQNDEGDLEDIWDQAMEQTTI